MDTISNLSSQEIIIAAVIWIILGVANDLIKLLFRTVGGYVSYVPNLIAKSSKRGNNYLQAHINKEDKTVLASELIGSIKTFFLNTKNSLQFWARNFLFQVVEEGTNESDPQIASSWKSMPEQQKVDGLDVSENQPQAKRAGQRIIGALIEFIALGAFLYADACQAAQTYSVIFPTQKIPEVLNNITVPLVIASAGTAFILGIFIGDLLGLTHLSSWDKLKGTSKGNIVLGIMIINLIVTICLAILVALYRADVIDANNTSGVSNYYNWARNAQSLVIAPMLVTTTLLLRGVFGIFVVLSIAFSILSMPFAFFEYFTEIFGKFLNAGYISVDFMLSRFLLLVTSVIEIIFILLTRIVQGSFFGFTIMLTILFYIPYIASNLILKRAIGSSLVESLGDIGNAGFLNPDIDIDNDSANQTP